MATLGVFPPPEAVIGRLASLPGARVTMGPLFALDGPAPSGPEQAGAILVLQTTLTGEEAAGRFWESNETVLQAAMQSPGFVRFFGLRDGFCNYAIVFWRTAADAEAFAADTVHRTAVKDLYRNQSQYTHFARLYASPNPTPRQFICDECHHVTAAPATRCKGCGAELTDIFDTYARP